MVKINFIVKGKNKMKKLLTLLLAIVLTFALISCGTAVENDDAQGGNENVAVGGTVYENVSLEALANYLYTGINPEEMPMVMSMPVSAEDFEFFTFIPYEEGLEVVVNEPMIGAIAHSVVLVKADSTEKAEAVASSMKENCNPRKWVCVEADVVEAVTNGNIAMLLMTTAEGGMAETILANFAAFNAETDLEAGLADDEAVIEDEFVEDEFVEDEFVDGEVILPETDPEADVLPEVDADVNVPATMPEEDDMPAVMPEVTPEVMPEVEPEAVPEVMPEVEPETEDVPAEEGTIDDLYALADKLYEGIDPENMPPVGTMELNEENFEYSAFIPYKSTYLAVENMPMMGSQPHSVVIVKTGSPEEAAQVAADMEANANPRKWICVQAKSVKSAAAGNYAILVMTSVDVFPSEDMDEAAAEEASFKASEERADIIIANFKANA